MNDPRGASSLYRRHAILLSAVAHEKDGDRSARLRKERNGPTKQRSKVDACALQASHPVYSLHRSGELGGADHGQRFEILSAGNDTIEDVRGWFDALSARRLAAATRSPAVLSSLVKHSQAVGVRPEGSNPCRDLRPRNSRFEARYPNGRRIRALGRAFRQTAARRSCGEPLELLRVRREGANSCEVQTLSR